MDLKCITYCLQLLNTFTEPSERWKGNILPSTLWFGTQVLQNSIEKSCNSLLRDRIFNYLKFLDICSLFVLALLDYNLQTIKLTYKCVIQLFWQTHTVSCIATPTIKIENISITPRSSLMPYYSLCLPESWVSDNHGICFLSVWFCVF